METVDSSYDIIPVPVPPRRHPRAPTTVQIVGDDFDAVTHDVDHETSATEMYQFDGVTEVRSIKAGQGEQTEEEEVRFSGVYGEWAERHEVHHRQGPTPSGFGRMMEEVTRHLQEITTDEQAQWQSSTIKARGGADPRRTSRDEERVGKVNVWREEVARNKADLGEFGEMGSSNSSAAQRSRERTYMVDQGTIQSREVQNLKSTLRRIPLN
ncbi:hypothetical protein F5I97DRAFT_1415334 [Phlebopus sp. FC_14]|nr:hypothetical protein F5I97DRAFT_1415334 [Phlebopus sp. FC_14]